MPLKRNVQPKPRYLTLEAAGQKKLTSQEVQALNDAIQFKTNFGIEVGNGGFPVPTVGSGTPRVFLVQTDRKDMSDKVSSFHDSGLKACWDAEFWKQVQLGNVFVYPARSTKPCQLQLGRDGEGKLTLSVSEPLEPDKMPAREVKKPNGWQRFWHRIYSGFYKEQVESFDKAQDSGARIKSAVEAYNADRKKLDLKGEKDAAIQQQEQQERLKKDEEIRKVMAPIQAEHNALRDHTKRADELFGSDQPQYSLSRFGGPGETEGWTQPKRKAKLHAYPTEMKLGMGAYIVKKEDLKALCFFSAEDPIRAVETLSKPNMGGKAGLETIEKVIEPARDKIKEIQKDQEKKKSLKLVESLAGGLNKAAAMLKGKSIEGSRFTPAQKTAMKMAGDLHGFLKDGITQDPALETEIKKRSGSYETDMATIRGYAEFAKLNEQALKAKQELILSERDNVHLDKQTRMNHMKTIVKAEIVERIMAGELKEGKTAFTRSFPDKADKLDRAAEYIMNTERLFDQEKTGSELVQTLDQRDLTAGIVSVATSFRMDQQEQEQELEQEDKVLENDQMQQEQPSGGIAPVA